MIFSIRILSPMIFFSICMSFDQIKFHSFAPFLPIMIPITPFIIRFLQFPYLKYLQSVLPNLHARLRICSLMRLPLGAKKVNWWNQNSYLPWRFIRLAWSADLDALSSFFSWILSFLAFVSTTSLKHILVPDIMYAHKQFHSSSILGLPPTISVHGSISFRM